jgi:signal transduction histidine kinase
MRTARGFAHFYLSLFLLFIPFILRGGNSIESPIPKAVRDSIVWTMKDKPVLSILSIANEYSFSDMPLALVYADVALEKAQKNGNQRELFDVQRDLGFIYEDNALLDKALEAYYAASETAGNLHDTLKTTIYNDLAITHRKIGNFKAAYDYYAKVLDISQKTAPKDWAMIAGAYHGLGHLHREVGVYDLAIEYYLQSLDVSKRLRQDVETIVSYIDIAEAYAKSKMPQKALEHIELAYQLALNQKKLKPNDSEAHVQLASATNRYGEILASRALYDKALEKHEEALAIYRAINYKAYIARTLMLIADVYLQQKQYAKADAVFSDCLKAEDQFVNVDRAELHFKIGTLHRAQNRLTEAEIEFEKSLSLANTSDYKNIAQRANYQMFLVNFHQNKQDKALQYLNIANALSDSLFDIEKAKSIAGLELKFNSEKRDKEFAALKERETRLLLILSIAASLMLAIFLGYVIQMRGRNYRALKMKNEEIQNQYRRLEESNEILSQFAYVVAHDLKEPLRSIGSYIGLIQMKHGKDLPNDAKEYMQFVNAGVKRMYSLLTDLLDFSQVVSQQPGAEVTRPEEVLADVKDNLRNAIESKNAQIEFPTNLPSIRMNRMHLLQLFQNLIGNALKFSTRPPIVRVDGHEENGHIVLTIEDNGIGIKPDFRNKVFVLFQQLNKKGQFDGTGIGLTICKNIVEKYNGRIWFESEENVGTKFYIAIPAQAA